MRSERRKEIILMTFPCFQINNILLSQRHQKHTVTHALRSIASPSGVLVSARVARAATARLDVLIFPSLSLSLSLSRAERNIVLHREDVGDSDAR